ncbi:MAG: DNA-binding protein [Desulfuromonadaceae bacterium]|nr:DNA-binding protein [Desulfuromonadaceae bacterium]
MKAMGTFWATVMVVGLMVSSAAAQQGMMWHGSGGWGPMGEYCRMFSPHDLETMKGEIVTIEKGIPRMGMGHGVRMVLKTDKGEIPVHLGPSWYIENQDVKLEAGDQVEVTGARVKVQAKGEMHHGQGMMGVRPWMMDDQEFLMASEVKKGDQVLVLRDKDGMPRWGGWRSRGK